MPSPWWSLGLFAVGCASGPVDAPPPEPVPAAPLAETGAPAGASFRTVGSAFVTLPKERFLGFGRATFLKLALDPELVRSVVLARVQAGAPFRMEVSIPRAVSTLHYEIYDETGLRATGSVEVER